MFPGEAPQALQAQSTASHTPSSIYLPHFLCCQYRPQIFGSLRINGFDALIPKLIEEFLSNLWDPYGYFNLELLG